MFIDFFYNKYARIYIKINSFSSKQKIIDEQIAYIIFLIKNK